VRRTPDPFDNLSTELRTRLRASSRIGESSRTEEKIRQSCESVFLVSACLVGIPCQYNGGSHPDDRLQALAAQGRALPLCPEVLGGLPTPRPPAEIQGGDGSDVLEGRARVVNIEGEDVTAEFLAGAQKALQIARQWHIKEAILKARSPSCGAGQIYDGSFSGQLMEGDGVTAALLKQEGIIVKSEEEA